MSDEKQQKDEALKEVVGKTWEQAQKIFKEKYPQFTIRYNWKDGESVSGTKDLRRNRLNVGLQNNIVFERYAEHDGPYGREYTKAGWH